MRRSPRCSRGRAMAGKTRKTPGWILPPAPTPQDWWDALAQIGHLHQQCRLPEEVERVKRVERVQKTIFQQLAAMPPPRRQIDLIRHNAVVRHLLDGAKNVDDACDKAREEDLCDTPAKGDTGTIKASFQTIQSDEDFWLMRWPCAWGQSVCLDGQCQHDTRRNCGRWADWWAWHHQEKSTT
jgi:hypothetical protein